jgi:DNA-binding response OmpR family regulator
MIFLCIDDDPDDLELLSEAITRIDAGSICHVANSSENGLATLSRLRPDFIFLDINMPGMDGHQTLREIRSNRSFNGIPVCILSTTIGSNEKEVLLKMGANYCVKKATSFDELCNALKRLFSSRQQFKTHETTQ